MAKKLKPLTLEEMIDEGVKLVIGAFGKGEDLRGAVTMIIVGTSNWTEQNLKEYDKNIKRSAK